MDLCKVTLVGNVGRDPEMRYTPAGKPVLNFSVACNRMGPPPPDGGERDRITEWFRVSCFNRLAETSSNLVTKGSRVYVEGRLQTRTYTGQDGQPRFSVEVMANDVLMLTPRGQHDGGDHGMPMTRVAAGPATMDHDSLDDVPF